MPGSDSKSLCQSQGEHGLLQFPSLFDTIQNICVQCDERFVRGCFYDCQVSVSTYNLDICPEPGLSSQQYKCAECRKLIGLTRELYEMHYVFPPPEMHFLLLPPSIQPPPSIDPCFAVLGNWYVACLFYLLKGVSALKRDCVTTQGSTSVKNVTGMMLWWSLQEWCITGISVFIG